jgi:hypothetical protein
MKRLLLAVVVLALSSAALAAPVKKFEPIADLPLPPWSCKAYMVEFEGGQRACAIASGKTGNSVLTLCVYDRYGNCVAWDDEARAGTIDDLAVDWYPRQKAAYVVEVHNLGIDPDPTKIILR